MSNNSNTSSSGGMGFAGALALLFIALKLLGYIDWSWWWVLAPLWGSLGLALIIIVGAFVTVTIVESRGVQRRRRGF